MKRTTVKSEQPQFFTIASSWPAPEVKPRRRFSITSPTGKGPGPDSVVASHSAAAGGRGTTIHVTPRQTSEHREVENRDMHENSQDWTKKKHQHALSHICKDVRARPLRTLFLWDRHVGTRLVETYCVRATLCCGLTNEKGTCAGLRWRCSARKLKERWKISSQGGGGGKKTTRTLNESRCLSAETRGTSTRSHPSASRKTSPPRVSAARGAAHRQRTSSCGAGRPTGRAPPWDR